MIVTTKHRGYDEYESYFAVERKANIFGVEKEYVCIARTNSYNNDNPRLANLFDEKGNLKASEIRSFDYCAALDIRDEMNKIVSLKRKLPDYDAIQPPDCYTTELDGLWFQVKKWLEEQGIIKKEPNSKFVDFRKYYTEKQNGVAIIKSPISDAINKECDRIIKEAKKDICAIETLQKEIETAKIAEKKALLKDVKWDIIEKDFFDEDGRTREYIHTITVDNEQYIFCERNIFDFGRVINNKNGAVRYDSSSDRYYTDKPNEKSYLTPKETRAYIIVHKYGKYAHSGIRM